ncbi:Eukaryotic peptide chain release factor GTP-binding subunit [Tieghemiomyces parasiticus]|uniref:Palmitoyltransferase n=1 Tax=Tieghemiomyces parasiticus TaxID=78921 RepID=A0A9W8DN24_9FUNG|nr:Eukaryotic peptide chain release factor GTP-binding subunit [Tieghemiomyces parasiticus]
MRFSDEVTGPDEAHLRLSIPSRTRSLRPAAALEPLLLTPTSPDVSPLPPRPQQLPSPPALNTANASRSIFQALAMDPAEADRLSMTTASATSRPPGSRTNGEGPAHSPHSSCQQPPPPPPTTATNRHSARVAPGLGLDRMGTAGPVPSATTVHVRPAHYRRRYKIKGDRRVHVFLGGRLVTSRTWTPFVMAVGLIAAPVVLFCVFECPFIWHEVSPVWVILFGYLTLLVFSNMICAAWTDPGILPPDLHHDPMSYVTAGEPGLTNAATGVGSTTGSRSMSFPNLQTPSALHPNFVSADPNFAYNHSTTKQVLIHGVAIRLKYCDTCHIYRPPRASHCRQCNVCVENEDHHCAWLNNCVGRRNYRYFFIFVASCTALCAYVFSFALWNLLKPLVRDELDDEGQPYTFGSSLGRSPVSLVLIIYSFVFFWSVGGLTAYHIYLMSRNLTTHEQIKSSYSAGRRRYTSPFGVKASCLSNFCYVLCRPRPEPPVNWREYVDPAELPGNHGAGGAADGARPATADSTSTTGQLSQSAGLGAIMSPRSSIHSPPVNHVPWHRISRPGPGGLAAQYRLGAALDPLSATGPESLAVNDHPRLHQTPSNHSIRSHNGSVATRINHHTSSSQDLISSDSPGSPFASLPPQIDPSPVLPPQQDRPSFTATTTAKYTTPSNHVSGVSSYYTSQSSLSPSTSTGHDPLNGSVPPHLPSLPSHSLSFHLFHPAAAAPSTEGSNASLNATLHTRSPHPEAPAEPIAADYELHALDKDHHQRHTSTPVPTRPVRTPSDRARHTTSHPWPVVI